MKLCRFGVLAGLALISVGAFAGDEPMGVERLARLCKPGYQCTALSDDEALWIQVDLGRRWPVDQVKLFPALNVIGQSQGYPVRFKIEAASDARFTTATLLADQTAADLPDPGDKIGVFAAKGVEARYIRLTATKLREKQLWLTKFEVWSGGKDVAEQCAAADSRRGELGVTRLTRPARPQGEQVVTDNPANVTAPGQWKPVPYRARAPLGGVKMEDRLIQTAMKNNIGYLLATGTPDQLLKYFRDRAGQPNPPSVEVPADSWDHELRGSSAGRFLMGAGATLRFMEDAELRRRLDQVVDGIEQCRRADGYLMAYPEDTIFYGERGGYTRSWLTQGLIEAGRAGNPKAYPLLRGFYDWFDRSPYLPELLRRGGYGIQGLIANTLVYFTPIGQPADLQAGQRYFQENYWLDQLARREETAIWRYPYSHPHSYLLTAVEPYLDLYRATGQACYLEAARGTWELYHDNWEHLGGSIAICEGATFPPKSNFLTRNTGELCGNAFWARFNQRFHLLDPGQERYVAEIEKSIYNVALANQVTSSSIRYTALLVGKKQPGGAYNSCCEGQGTRFYGTLPEYVYSIADDGLYVNLFAASSIQWQQNQQDLQVRMVTDFPFAPGVELRLTAAQPTTSTIRVRVPGWATKDMAIRVNGENAATGKPGSYAALRRQWATGDRISFELPIGLRLTRYRGADEVAAGGRYALEYGPILMALVGMTDTTGTTQVAAGTTPLAFKPEALLRNLKANAESPLHFAIKGDDKHAYVPYWEVRDEAFTCFPVLTKTPGAMAPTPGPGDLALASLGATAVADSELAYEPGCTAQAIDGIVASDAHPANRWHSSIETSCPHWIEVKLRRPEQIGRVVIRFAKDPAGYPLSFQGLAGAGKAGKVLFDQTDYPDWRGFELSFPPLTADTFRLVIRESANMPFPTWSNHVSAAQISEIELYAPE